MSETPEIFPLYFTPGIPEGDSWRFQNNDNVTIVSDKVGYLKNILEYSNGHSPIEEILTKLEQDGEDREEVERVINDLRHLGVLVDSREIALETHDSTNNPPTFFRPLTDQDVFTITFNDPYEPKKGRAYNYRDTATHIGGLSLKRESCRDFSGIPLEPEKIITCLKNSYSQEIRPIPSAGGLYPLRIYMIQKLPTQGLPKGMYQYDHNSNSLVLMSDEVDDIDLSYVFSNENLLHNAPTIVVIAADLDRQNAKYANRSYRYTLLEAGHCAQNIHLTAIELGATTLEFGGFNDYDLAKAFDMSKRERPLATIALGYKNVEMERETFFDVNLVKGPGKPVEWSSVDFNSPVSKVLRFYKATAKFRKPNSAYGDEDNLLASGTAASPQLAEIKATAEAYERYMAGQVRYDILEAAVNLPEGKWLSPDLIRHVSEEQHAKSQYTEPFDPSKPIQWIEGKHINNSGVYVPIELVFYPVDISKIGRLLTAETDSSGMAAHPNYHEAVKRALLELVERDALMRTWMSKEPPQRIDPENLPIFYQKRAQFWSKLGKKVEFLDFSHDDIAVVGVIIHSTDKRGYPYMTAGASASTDSFNEALKKACHEAELGAAEYLTSPYKVKKLKPEEVFSPADHANFYAHPDYRSEIEWLWSGPIRKNSQVISGQRDLLQLYKPIIVELTSGDEPLRVVRTIVPNLVPISFGYGNELYLHPKVKTANYVPAKVPHFFA